MLVMHTNITKLIIIIIPSKLRLHSVFLLKKVIIMCFDSKDKGIIARVIDVMLLKLCGLHIKTKCKSTIALLC